MVFRNVGFGESGLKCLGRKFTVGEGVWRVVKGVWGVWEGCGIGSRKGDWVP